MLKGNRLKLAYSSIISPIGCFLEFFAYKVWQTKGGLGGGR
jgi:hypothetical protein